MEETSSSCTPKTCADLGYNCGPAGDGCGGESVRRVLRARGVCGGGGFSRCGIVEQTPSACTPKTCTDLGYDCGPAGDGCGGVLQCGMCPPPVLCGGGGFGRCSADGGMSDSDAPDEAAFGMTTDP